MKALLVDHRSTCHLRLGDAEDPDPCFNEALVRVAGVGLNRGEVARLESTEEGKIPGWDASGFVIRAAEDGTGPAVGSPVLSLDARGAGWAELRACRTDFMVPLPTDSDVAAFAALPVAGLSALRSLRSLGFIAGRRVMVTGASGGVGRFMIQLARMGGADVVAVSSTATHDELKEMGVAETVTAPSEVAEEVWAVVDLVGGETLPQSFAVLADPGGRLVSIGHSEGEDEVFKAGALRASSRSIETFYLFAQPSEIAEDLALLVALVTRGDLVLPITWRGSWEKHCDAISKLMSRQIHGKAVLEVA